MERSGKTTPFLGPAAAIIGVYFVSNVGEATGKKNSRYMQFFLLLHEEKNSIHPWGPIFIYQPILAAPARGC